MRDNGKVWGSSNFIFIFYVYQDTIFNQNRYEKII